LVAVHARPDIDGACPRFGNLGQDGIQGQCAIHGGGENIVETEFRPGSQRGSSGQCGSGSKKLTARDVFHTLGERMRGYQSFCEANRAPSAKFWNFAQTMLG